MPTQSNMQPSQLDDFIQAFSIYIENGDAQGLTPFLAVGANPAFLKIYRNGVFKACIEALSSNFPTLKSYLGNKQFKTLSHDYVQQYWPNDTRLSSYGDHIVEFINDNFLPFSQDFAKLDRAWLDALFANDEQSLTRKDIEEILTQEGQQELFSLQLANSVNLVYLSGDSLNEWLKLKFATDDFDTQADSKAGETDQTIVLIWRYQQEVQYRVLDQFEESFINAMHQSESILNSAETAIATNPSQNIGALFGALLTAGILIKNQTSNQE